MLEHAISTANSFSCLRCDVDKLLAASCDPVRACPLDKWARVRETAAIPVFSVAMVISVSVLYIAQLVRIKPDTVTLQ